MDYSTSAYHPYAEFRRYLKIPDYYSVYRRPLASPFPQGVALGTTGVPTRSAAARLLDIEHDFPGKFERRAEINRLKSKRRLEAMDYGLLPYNSWATYLKPSTPARHYYSPQYALEKSPDYPIVISRYPVRPLRMVQLAPLSVRCVRMPEQNADALTLELEADDARFQSQQDARRVQSSIWQSEATDRAIRLCKDRNRIRNQLRRIENARLVGPIFSRLGAPEQLGTRQKVLINYHKGAKSEVTPHHESAVYTTGKSKTEFKETPAQLPTKTHEDIVKAAEVQQAEESQRSQQSTFSAEEQQQEEAAPPPVEPEPAKQTIARHKEEQEREKEVEKEKEREKEIEREKEAEKEKEKEKKPKKEHKYETAKEKRRREQQEKKAAEQKEEKIAEPESPQIQTSLEPLSLKIKEQTKEKAAVEPASPDITASVVLPSPKAKKQIEPTSPKIKEEIFEPSSPKIKEEIFEPTSIVQEEVFEPTSPKIKEKSQPTSPIFQPESPKIFEAAKPLSLKIKEQTSELTENVLPSPKPEERQTPLQSPAVYQEEPTFVAETEVETEAPKEAAPAFEPEAAPVSEPEPEPASEITTEKEPEPKDDKLPEAYSPLVRDEPPQFETQKSIEDQPPQFESQTSVEDQSAQLESQKSTEDQSPHYESQKSVEDVTETLPSEEPQQEPVDDVERQTSVASPELPVESESAAEEAAPEKEAEEEEPQSPTVLRRLISNVSNLEGDACDPSEWDADEAVEVELPSEKKGIILSASDNAIPDREDHYEAEEDAVTPAITTEEPSTEEGTDTVVWAKGNNAQSFRLSTERADDLTDLSVSTNENAEAGSALTGDNAEETLSANGRPLSVDAESLAADDEQILDEALETTYSMHDRNLEPRVEEPDEETFKYDENVEYRSKSISIEEDE